MYNSICSIFLTIPIYLIVLIINIKNKISLKKQIIWFLFFGYITAVIAVTLFPFPFEKEMMEIGKQMELKNNFIPFKGIVGLISDNSFETIVRNILGNILLTMPFGFLASLLWTKIKDIKKILFLGMGFSITIELSQFLLSLYLGYTYKVTDIDDIILNTIGALLGYIAYKLVCIIKE